jgi:hypothetical protein
MSEAGLYCKTGAQANKPHFHEMLMRHTWMTLYLPFQWAHGVISHVSISWRLVKRAENRSLDTAAVQCETSYPIVNISTVATRLLWTVDFFPISRYSRYFSVNLV